MRKKRVFIVLGTVCFMSATILTALHTGLKVRNYQIVTDKLSVPVRLVLLTDLHCCAYGEGQQTLIDAVLVQEPDLVLLGGDIVDDDKRLPIENALVVVRALSERCPTYYVTGNHEFWSREVDVIRARLEEAGAVLLAGDCVTAEAGEQTIQICGIDDPDGGEAAWTEQLERVTRLVRPEQFSILLSHRPERVDQYENRGFDLILAGHAHGGQWRLPGLINGLAAPNQGIFPKYAGGRYELGDSTLIVSRGLALETTDIPRIFNPPEIVTVDLLPEGM